MDWWFGRRYRHADSLPPTILVYGGAVSSFRVRLSLRFRCCVCEWAVSSCVSGDFPMNCLLIFKITQKLDGRDCFAKVCRLVEVWKYNFGVVWLCSDATVARCCGVDGVDCCTALN